MSQTSIPNGYILLSRRILESEIMAKPPLYLKIWIYLLTKAQHREYKSLKRGQLFTSIPEIREAMSYMVGFRKETPSYKQVRGVLDWLRFPCDGNANGERREPMIVTTKGTHGMLVTIVNYDLYQDPKNYEGQPERHYEGTTKDERRARQGHNINKNDKNDKNDIKQLSVEKEKSKIPSEFIKTFAYPPNQIQLQMLTSFLDDGLTEWHILEALKLSAEGGAKSPQYTKVILQDWVRKEAFTKEDVENLERTRVTNNKPKRARQIFDDDYEYTQREVNHSAFSFLTDSEGDLQ